MNKKLNIKMMKSILQKNPLQKMNMRIRAKIYKVLFYIKYIRLRKPINKNQKYIK